MTPPPSPTPRPQVLLYTAHLSTTGGGQHALTRLAVALAGRGYPVVLVTEPPFVPEHRYSRWLRRAGVPVEVLPAHEPGIAFRALRGLVQWLGALPWAALRRRTPGAAWSSLGEIFRTLHIRRRYRRIHRRMSQLADAPRAILHVWGPSALTPELLEWARASAVPAIYHEMGEADATYVTTWGLSRTVDSVGHAACVVCCSTSVAHNIRDVYRYPGPIHTIPFPVDDPPPILPTRPEGGPVVFGAIGRLVPHKRHAELIRAVGALRDDGCLVELLIAGDGPARADLEQQARERGLAQAVHLIGEFDDLAAVMARFDVFALTSASESQCMPITESMAYGKAVIASRFGGMPDFVEHGVTGLLVELGDAEGLAAAMRRLATDAALRKRMGEAGRARYLRDYTERDLVNRYERIFAELRPAARVP